MNLKTVQKWDMECDVAIVGYGGAGAAAAIAARDLGADAVMLEKMAEGGGNTRISGGMMTLPASMDYAKYLEVLTFKCTPQDVIERFVEESLETEAWFKELGGELVKYTGYRTYIPTPYGVDYPQLPFADQALKRMVKGPAGAPVSLDDSACDRLWSLLSRNVERRGVKVLTGTPARELVTSDEGRVVGVAAETGGKRVLVKARKAVVLTCGGFEFDEAMKWDSLPAKPVFGQGAPGNSGDGVRMAQQAGAGLWHMSNLSCGLGFRAPGHESTFYIKFSSERFIYVDKYGRRFTDEATTEIHEYAKLLSHFDAVHRIEYPRIPIYAIFDEALRKKAPLHDAIMGYNRLRYKYVWSPDNSEEVKKGWIVTGRTIGEVAGKLSMDKAVLEKTVAAYNEYCQMGKDPDFDRPQKFLAALDVPPYYAMQLWPGLFNTQGGPRRDREARVLDAFDGPIKGLYSAGELGSIWGQLYIGGSNIAEALAFGRIAGRNAAAEEPWG